MIKAMQTDRPANPIAMPVKEKIPAPIICPIPIATNSLRPSTRLSYFVVI